MNHRNSDIPNFSELSAEQLRNWMNDMPEPYSSEARRELIRRGEAL